MAAIRIDNATENNLQGISLEIPRQRVTVISGVSGSGKSTLAYNILYAEGQRRYIESLAPFARQFLHLFQKPKVDGISGLAPTLSIQQNPGAANVLSTVGTLSECYDYLRLLFYSSARQNCHPCGRPLRQLGVSDIAGRIGETLAGREITVYAPVIRQRKGNYKALLSAQARKGWRQVRVDGDFRPLAGLKLDRHRKHTIEIPVGAGRRRRRRQPGTPGPGDAGASAGPGGDLRGHGRRSQPFLLPAKLLPGLRAGVPGSGPRHVFLPIHAVPLPGLPGEGRGRLHPRRAALPGS